jgi:hypothetical protein
MGQDYYLDSLKKTGYKIWTVPNYIDKRIRSAIKLSDIEKKAILVNNIAVSTREVQHPLGVCEKGSSPLR